MAVDVGIYLYNSAVNSGTAVRCNGASFDYGWSNLLRGAPVPGKFDITIMKVGGWENPKINLQGTIDVDSSDSNVMTEVLLKNFARAHDSQTSISIGIGVSGTITPISTSTASVSETTNGGKTGVWIPVVIKSFSVLPQGERGHILNYKINFIEDTS